MSFYNVIDELVNLIDTKIDYPIRIVMGLRNSVYIEDIMSSK